MSFAGLLEEFVADIGWKDEIETLEDEALSRLAVRLKVGAGSFRLLLEGYEAQQWLVLSLYAPFPARQETLVDLCLLFNYLNATFSYPGHICAEDEAVCYRHIVDAGASGSGFGFIYNMLGAATDLFERHAAVIEAVAAGEAGYEDARMMIERGSQSRGLSEEETH
ncbi:MAG: hypothetical protein FJZ79_03480 [Chlorobi bacterium]|nr:hypothetical protein [Chlorobiota bacterium]